MSRDDANFIGFIFTVGLGFTILFFLICAIMLYVNKGMN